MERRKYSCGAPNEKHTDESDTGGEPSNKSAKTSNEGHVDKMAEVEMIEGKT